jgi:tetratricopeptide (TPR) repeat protein
VSPGRISWLGWALLAAACTPPPPPPPPGILVVTTPAGTDLSAIDEALDSVVRFDEAWAHARHTRPALASLWTGVPPNEHGLTAPASHALAVPTVADELQQAGWATCRAVAHGDDPRFDPLWPDEDWGFAGVGMCSGPRTLTWLHTATPLEAIRSWQALSPNGTVFLTGLPADRPLEQGGGRVPMFWIGSEDGVRTDLQGQIAIPAAIRTLAAPREPGPHPPLFPRPDLPRVESVDALPRLAAGGPVVWVERTPGGVEVESIALPSPTDRLVPPWPLHQSLPTDPLGHHENLASAASVDLLEDARIALSRGRLRKARDLLDRSQRRIGPTVAEQVLRARLEWRAGEPRAAFERLREVYADHPSPALAAQIGHTALALRRPDLAAPWLDRVLAEFPDDPPTLAARIRCARAAGSEKVAADLAGRLWAIDGHWAARVAIRDALDRRQAISPAWIDRLEGPAGVHADPELRLLRARIAWQTGDAPSGLEAIEALLADHPRHIDTRLTAASWYIELGEVERASRLLGPVRRWFPDDLRVAALSQLTRDALAEERMRLQWLRGVWRNRP